MVALTKKQFTQAANNLAITWCWKGATWDAQKVTRYLAALRRAAKNTKLAPKYIIAYVRKQTTNK